MTVPVMSLRLATRRASCHLTTKFRAIRFESTKPSIPAEETTVRDQPIKPSKVAEEAKIAVGRSQATTGQAAASSDNVNAPQRPQVNTKHDWTSGELKRITKEEREFWTTPSGKTYDSYLSPKQQLGLFDGSRYPNSSPTAAEERVKISKLLENVTAEDLNENVPDDDPEHSMRPPTHYVRTDRPEKVKVGLVNLGVGRGDPDALEEDQEFEYDDISALAHGDLEQIREHREYARIAAWEMPLLSRKFNSRVVKVNTDSVRIGEDIPTSHRRASSAFQIHHIHGRGASCSKEGRLGILSS